MISFFLFMRRHSVPFTIELCTAYLYSIANRYFVRRCSREAQHCHDNETQTSLLRKPIIESTYTGTKILSPFDTAIFFSHQHSIL